MLEIAMLGVLYILSTCNINFHLPKGISIWSVGYDWPFQMHVKHSIPLRFNFRSQFWLKMNLCVVRFLDCVSGWCVKGTENRWQQCGLWRVHQQGWGCCADPQRSNHSVQHGHHLDTFLSARQLSNVFFDLLTFGPILVLQIVFWVRSLVKYCECLDINTRFLLWQPLSAKTHQNTSGDRHSLVACTCSSWFKGQSPRRCKELQRLWSNVTYFQTVPKEEDQTEDWSDHGGRREYQQRLGCHLLGHFSTVSLHGSCQRSGVSSSRRQLLRIFVHSTSFGIHNFVYAVASFSSQGSEQRRLRDWPYRIQFKDASSAVIVFKKIEKNPRS